MAGLCKTRRVGVLAACAASIGAGIVLLWLLLPHAIARVGTMELLALLGLFVLPAAATMSLVLERQSRRGRQAAAAPHETSVAAKEPPAPGPVEVSAASGGDAWAPVWSQVAVGGRETTGGGGGAGRLMVSTRR